MTAAVAGRAVGRAASSGSIYLPKASKAAAAKVDPADVTPIPKATPTLYGTPAPSQAVAVEGGRRRRASPAPAVDSGRPDPSPDRPAGNRAPAAAAPPPRPSSSTSPPPRSSSTARPSRWQVGAAGVGAAANGAAGFALALLFWGWVALPMIRGGPTEVRNVLRAKFINKGPDGRPLP